MSRPVLLALVLAAVLAVPAASVAGAMKDVPEWARAAIADTSTFGAGADAVVLLDARDLRVSNDGRVTTHVRRVIRLLTQAGIEQADCTVYYVENQGRPPELSGLLVPAAADAAPRPLPPAADLLAAHGEVRGEVRMRVLAPGPRARPGDVMVAEWTHEDAPPFLAIDLVANLGPPVRRSELRLDWPPGWTLTSRWLPSGRLDSTTAAGTRTWVFDRLDPPGEAARGGDGGPRHLAFAFAPDHPLRARSFGSWEDVSAWFTDYVAGRDGGATVTTSASAAVSGVESERGRIAALSREPQAARYVALEVGLGRGGGYLPRPAAEVLDMGYGDCKDKANLFSGLAKAAGFRAWLVLASVGRRDSVCASWPSPQQFNHCICAVAVSDSLDSPAVLRGTRLGALLFFDATDPDTPLGELPLALQGSLALVADGGRGQLVRLPATPPSANRVDWTITAALEPGGRAEGTVRSECFGAAASARRSALRQRGEAGLAQAFVYALARRAPGTVLADLHFGAGDGDRGCRADGRWSSSTFARTLSDGGLVFGLPSWGERAGLREAERDEEDDGTLAARSETERCLVRWPAGMHLVSAPADTSIVTAFASFVRRTRTAGDSLVVEQTWTSLGGPVPSDSLQVLRGLRRRIGAEARGVWRLAAGEPKR